MKALQLLCVASLAAAAAGGCRQTPAQPEEPEPTAHAKPAPKPARFEELLGRWLRPDGGYVLEVGPIDDQGLAKVGYFNPRPINVSNARAVWEGDALKLFVELSDAGYPGSTYTLVHDRQQDQLHGTYFQAAMNETFQVVFVRVEE